MADSNPILGQIISGVVIGAVLGIGGFILGKATSPDAPPVAAISPDVVSVSAGETIQFSAAGSTSSVAGITNYSWKIGGHLADRSSVGFCQASSNGLIATCRFELPGTFSVSVDVTDDTGLSATAVAPVTVSLENGYIGVVLFAGHNSEISDQAYRVILAAIDWQVVQRSVSRPIVIFDPDKQVPVYAASVPFVEGAVDALGTEVFQGAKLMIPPFAPAVRDVISATIEGLGSTVLAIPLGEIEASLQSGLAGSGFLGFNSPDDYISSLTE
jgi:PKD repeat protein